MLGNVVQSPMGTFGLMSIEKMYFQQPILFPSAYLNNTMNITYTPFSTNAVDVSPANLSIGHTSPLVLRYFTSTLTFGTIPYGSFLQILGTMEVVGMYSQPIWTVFYPP